MGGLCIENVTYVRRTYVHMYAHMHAYNILDLFNCSYTYIATYICSYMLNAYEI